jgi:YHS domain-containing protein
MQNKTRSLALIAALAVILVAGVVAQQKAADTAIDPVCGMTVVKANAKATFDYKGTTYYFCNTGCKESFAKEPDKYLKAQQAKAAGTAAAATAPAAVGQMGHMGGQMGGQMGMMKHEGMAGCEMCGGQGKGMMHCGRGMHGQGMMPGGPMAPLFKLYGDKIEVVVENAKDGAALKITSKDPEVVKAIQVHMAEHMVMMKKMKEGAAMAPAAGTGVKAPGESACADCQMIKK